jgi:menaquinone reductase, molybdopterin-binding-like subunit
VPHFTRRGLLQALAASGAAAAAGCRKYAGPSQVSQVPAGWFRGEERGIATTCGQCPAGCGITVRVHEGRAIKIEGTRDHPINGGGLGPKGQAGLQLLYHPDRIRGPMRRDGARGSGRWISISWNEAIDRLASALAGLRASGEPQGLVVIDGEPRGPVPRLWERFLNAYGSPNHVRHLSTTDGGSALAMELMQGVPDGAGYDWPNTEYVLGFGASLFESSCQAIHMARATSAMRRGQPGKRVKFVHVSPRFSVTAAKADEWVRIEPATYGALALGIAHVLIRDALYDVDFVQEHTFGFESWRDGHNRTHRGFRELVLAEYTPESVSRITGAKVEVIERIAREMSTHRPAIALAEGAGTAATNALGSAMAIHSLNALLGSIERRGGVLARRTALPSWTSVEADDIARRGLAATPIDGRGTTACPLGAGSIQRVPDAILSGRPYPVRALVLYRSNPIFSKPESGKWIEALQRIPLVVSCSPLPDESTLWADLVLPDHTYLERWESVDPAPSSGTPIVGLRQPVVRPRHNTMATGDVVVRLGRALGGGVAAAFPWADYRAAVTEQLQGIERDSPALVARMEKTGSWWTARRFEQWDAALATPTGKFEFYSQTIASRLAALFPTEDAREAFLTRSGVRTRGDDLCLPHWEPPQLAGDSREYPFVLDPYRGINYAEGGVRHLPWLRELPAAGLRAWKETIEMNPDDARRLALEEGDSVVVESAAGQRRFDLCVHPATAPGIIGLPLGHGPWPPTVDDARAAPGHGLLVALSDPLAGIFAHHGTRVRVRKET